MHRAIYYLLFVLLYGGACAYLVHSGAGDEYKIPATGGKPPIVRLGDTLSIELKQESVAAGKKYLLYLGSTPISGLQPETTQRDGKSILSFTLARTNESTKPWETIFGRLKSFEPTPIEVCVGPDDHSQPLTCLGPAVNFQTISTGKFLFWSISAVIIIGLLFWRARSATNPMLRDWFPGGLPAANKPKVAAYSLARVQMAFWFVLIILAFLFIWLVTGGTPGVSNSMLVLMGIGSGTALGAAVIDESNKQPSPTTGDFLQDLLTNADGYGFHRVQMFVWTLVLGTIFIVQVVITLSMPEFNDTLLGLMGISSGTYLGFKLPEKKT